MMKKYLIAFLALGLAGTSPAMAECAADMCVGVKITGVYAYGAASPGYAWVMTSGNESLLTACTADSGTYLRVDGSEPKSDWLYSLLLTAYQTDQNMIVRVASGGGVCKIAYAVAQK